MTVVVMTGALLAGVVLNYLVPEQVFAIIASIATFATVWVWLMILLAHFRSRRRMSAEQRSALAFPVPMWPYAQVAAIAFMLFVLGVLAYAPDTRIALVVGAAWLALLGLAYWIWVHPSGPASEVDDAATSDHAATSDIASREAAD